MGKATQDLRKEHGTIHHVLKIMDRMILSDTPDEESLLRYYGEVIYFLKIFADTCHHGKEENFLFKELAENEIPGSDDIIATLLEEHVQGREFISQMSHSLDIKDIDGCNAAATHYRDLLTLHIEKESNILFPMADKTMSDEEQELLFQKFEEFEETVIGQGVHEKLHAMVETWAEAFEAK